MAGAYLGCVGGALLRDDYLALLARAGFEQVEIVNEIHFDAVVEPDHEAVVEIMRSAGVTLAKAQVREVLASIVSLGIRAHR